MDPLSIFAGNLGPDSSPVEQQTVPQRSQNLDSPEDWSSLHCETQGPSRSFGSTSCWEILWSTGAPEATLPKTHLSQGYKINLESHFSFSTLH